MNKSLSTKLNEEEMEYYKETVGKWEREIDRNVISGITLLSMRLVKIKEMLSELRKRKVISLLREKYIIAFLSYRLFVKRVQRIETVIIDRMTDPIALSFFWFGGVVFYAYILYNISAMLINWVVNLFFK